MIDEVSDVTWLRKTKSNKKKKIIMMIGFSTNVQLMDVEKYDL